ncbi:MAG: hypothetical protein FJ118_06905 [Deltaproteobacteria bacterium]|nr:hypothetical protein [Deltaproteobacteria bacterium]
MANEELKKAVLIKLEGPGWTTARAVLAIVGGEMDESEMRRVEEAMLELAAEGKVELWRLILDEDKSEVLVAALPGMELDKELERRQAWAMAVRYAAAEK